MGAATEQSASTDSYPPQPSANAIPLPPSPVESLTPGSAENGTVIANTAELETSPVAPRPGAAVGDTQRTSQQQPEQDDSILTPAMRVRRNIFNRTLAAVSNLGLSKRVLLFLKGAITLAQVIVFVVILGVTSSLPCDKPLRTFLALHVVRVAISFPLSLYQTIAPPRLSRQGNQNAEAVARREANRIIGSRMWDKRVKTLSDAFAVLALVVFCLGNWWWWTGGGDTSSCPDTNPLLFWASLAALCFGYLYLVEVLLIVLAVVFFLPLLIITLRAFGVGEKKHEIGPLQQSEINKIPLVLYVPGPEEEEHKTTASAEGEKPPADQQLEESPAQPPPVGQKAVKPKGKKERRFMTLFQSTQKRKGAAQSQFPKGGGSVDGYIAAPYPYHPLPPNQSTCPICLTDFVTPPRVDQEIEGEPEWEPLRLLSCGHCLHMECLDPWLGSSGRCPVCQKPVESTAKKGKRRARSDTTTTNDPPPV